MARTIEEIKSSITTDFMNNEEAAAAYGFEPGTAFDEIFSRISVESVWLYIVACAMWVLETLFDTHKSEIDERIANMAPHTARWYRDKALLFMPNKKLMAEGDKYDTSGMTEANIARNRPVKYAAVTESADSSILTIKVAGESSGERKALPDTTIDGLISYFAQIKDAGVRIEIISRPGDQYSCEADIYYNAMYDPEIVKSLCESAITEHIKTLPFNGEYSNMALVDVLQTVEGVNIVELKTSYSNGSTIDGRCIPESGYFVPAENGIILNMKAHN